MVPLKYAHPEGEDYWDKNWLTVNIQLKVGAFKGVYSCHFQTTDFTYLQKELDKLYGDLSHEFIFSTLEDQLEISFKGDGLGHIWLAGKAMDLSEGTNTLNFEFSIDQSFLPKIIAEIKAVNRTFRVLQ